jgi:hypothetical protein
MRPCRTRPQRGYKGYSPGSTGLAFSPCRKANRMKVGKRTPEDRQIAVAVGAVTSKDDTFSVILGSPYGSILANSGHAIHRADRPPIAESSEAGVATLVFAHPQSKKRRAWSVFPVEETVGSCRPASLFRSSCGGCKHNRGGNHENAVGWQRGKRVVIWHRRRARRLCHPTGAFLSAYFADAGKTGSLPTSRASCWMTTVALRLAAIFLKRSSEASVRVWSVLNIGTPLVS